MLPLLLATLLQGPIAPQLSLHDALQRGLSARARTGEARAAIAEARAGSRLAARIPNPTVSFEHTGDIPHQHLLFDQSLAWLATRGADRGAAAARIRRAKGDSIVLVAAVAREIRSSFFGAVGARESQRLVEEQVAVADSLARLAQRRFEAGDISRFEWQQTAQEARRGQQLLSSAREATRIAGAAFTHAIAWAGPAVPSPADPLDLNLDLVVGFDPPADSIPALLSAVADSAALALDYRSAQRARLPIPSLTAGAEWGDPDVAGKTLSVLGFSVPLPIWNAGGAEAALARARAERGAAIAREARSEATRTIAETRARLEETARRARFARDSLLPAARALREQALAAYRAGETSVLSVLDALRGEREVAQNQVDNLIAFQVALAAWHALFGRTE